MRRDSRLFVIEVGKMRRIIFAVVFLLGLFSGLSLTSAQEDIQLGCATPIMQPESDPDMPNCGSDGTLPDGVYESNDWGDCPVEGFYSLGPHQLCTPYDGSEYDGGHDTWRSGQRGDCQSWMDPYACDLWQQGYNFPEADGTCVPPLALIPGEVSRLGVDACQLLENPGMEGLNGGWYDDEGNPEPHLGNCPDGYFLTGGACQEVPEDAGHDSGASVVEQGTVADYGDLSELDDKGEPLPQVGWRYANSPEDDGINCRFWGDIDADILVTLWEGEKVMVLDDTQIDSEGNAWYRVDVQRSGISSCFVREDGLAIEPTFTAPDIEVDATGPDVAGQIADDSKIDSVVRLPSTGFGDNADDSSTVVLILGAMSLIALAGGFVWRNRRCK